MKIFVITIQIGILYLFHMLGVWISESLHLFIPGSVVGMILLFIALSTGKFKSKWVSSGSTFMLAYLPLFFIPVTAGIIKYPEFFTVKGLLLIASTAVSTFLAVAATGWSSERLVSKKKASVNALD
ncbi:CidA/LrgA family protein [Fictibacillus terranigra]|uniref:CidA/LrgA family protein n=1 Tax=Fictibacillus terranigra TaxID=3058424 RepID=A0ABT8E3R4_9BACL|nr:CidA/LrgA family protein [Fictibacillus sp. CENA-BCM004]MDN4072548.1 CidA/LrgA family protein [Fictibacillus sp. CENA-BCM004]